MQCSMLSLHFSNLIIYVFKIIQKPRQNWSVSAFISQNASVEVCNLTLTDPAHSGAKHLDFCSLRVAFPCCPRLWRIPQGPGLSVAKLSLPSCQGGGGTDRWDPKAQQCLLCSYWDTPGVALLLWSGLGVFYVFAERPSGELQNSPYKSKLEIATGGGNSFLAVQSLLLIYFHTATSLLRAKMFELTGAH